MTYMTNTGCTSMIISHGSRMAFAVFFQTLFLYNYICRPLDNFTFVDNSMKVDELTVSNE